MGKSPNTKSHRITLLPDTCAMELMSCDIPEEFLTKEALDKRKDPGYGKRKAPLTVFRDILYHLPHHVFDTVMTDVIFEEYTHCLPNGRSNHPHMDDKPMGTEEEQTQRFVQVLRDAAAGIDISKHKIMNGKWEFAQHAAKGDWGVRVQPLKRTKEWGVLEEMRDIHQHDTLDLRIMRRHEPKVQSRFRELYKGVKDRGEMSVHNYLAEFPPQRWIFLSEDDEARQDASVADTDSRGVSVDVLQFFKELHRRGVLQDMGFKSTVTPEVMVRYMRAEVIRDNVVKQLKNSYEAEKLVANLKLGEPVEIRGGYFAPAITLAEILDEKMIREKE